jgi:glyoxylase-like metal-dependent hydrolase (beta-lactamase superfamily II)
MAGPAMRFGDVEINVLQDGRGRLPREILFSDVPAGELEPALGAEYPADFPYNCLLIRRRGSSVLVDTGLGAARHPLGGEGGRLWDELAAVGQRPEDVGVVVISHGHPDHIGGLVQDGTPAFHRARYVASSADWQLWTSEDALEQMPEPAAAAARAQLPPLEAAGILDRVDGEHKVASGVRVLPAPGHTPGQLAVEVEGALLYTVDALLHPLHVERPDVGRGTDADPERAIATRRALLERASEGGLVVGASHMDMLFRVERSGEGFRAVEP